MKLSNNDIRNLRKLIFMRNSLEDAIIANFFSGFVEHMGVINSLYSSGEDIEKLIQMANVKLSYACLNGTA